MVSRVWSFVDAEGRATGATFMGAAEMLEVNTPPGCTAVDGVLAFEARIDRDLQRDRVLQQIEALELRQARPLRELAMDPGNIDAAHVLAEIDDRITELRGQL